MEKSSKLDSRLFGNAVDLDVIIQKYRLAVEKAINETDLIQLSPLSREAQAIMKAGGKRLRPVLLLMSCEAVSGQYASAIPAALAYELAHEASLVQDDIFDNSDLRHDKETVHKRQGLIAAVLVSDLMIFEIFNQLAKYDSTSLTKTKLARLMSYISRAANLTIRGEYLEARYATKSSFSEQEYLEVAELKTGSLLAATAASGALVGGATDEIVDAMYRFGLNLGIAFQIRDDILDVSGDSAQLGKPVMKDLQNNVCNIVLINALEMADAYHRSEINSMLYKKWFAISDIKNLRTLLNDLKSIEYASKLSEKYTIVARECLTSISYSPSKDKLIGLTYALETRKV
ncbi:MAG: polyprenyl synthetase family protein [Thaumarchaeota archaeon]|nr:polyprenyl synthetase family protein [Nitrososphaerota archaeon]